MDITGVYQTAQEYEDHTPSRDDSTDPSSNLLPAPDGQVSEKTTAEPPSEVANESHTTNEDALLAIDLRIRLLETILAGSISSSDAFHQRVGGPDRQKIGTRAETVVKKLNDILLSKHNEVVRRFVQSYDLNEPLLHIPNPIHQQNQSILEKHQQLTVNEKLSLVLESGSEITSLEQELREIDLLNSRGFLEVDRLADGEASRDQLRLLTQEAKAQIEKYAALESRVTSVMSGYDSYVNTLSELFISWDGILTTVEDEVMRIEKSSALD